MDYVTAGESHGPKLTAIVSGVPAGVRIDPERIDVDMARRQSGYGRGGRQAIERDKAQITSGVRFGKTTGAPIAIEVANRDWENWTDRMAHFGDRPDDYEREVQPRPGHADLVGIMRTDSDDCRDILERSSARETAARVAACGIAKEMLRTLGVEVASYVVSIGDESMDDREFLARIDDAGDMERMRERIEASETRCPDEDATQRMKNAIDHAKSVGESLGGTFRVIVTGCVPGLGSYTSGRERLTPKLAAAVCSIPAIKGVEFGLGFEASRRPGSEVHDPIALDSDTDAFARLTNNAGGLEGGMSTGEPIVVTGAMKPIPTLMSPLPTVNVDTLEAADASKERSDVCAVPAAAVVAEGEVAMVIADAYLDAFGCTSMTDLKAAIADYEARIAEYAVKGCSR